MERALDLTLEFLSIADNYATDKDKRLKDKIVASKPLENEKNMNTISRSLALANFNISHC